MTQSPLPNAYTTLTNILTTTDDYGNANKPLWHYIKCQHQDKVGIGTLNAPDDTAVIHPDEKAQLLNDQFELVFTSDDLQNLPTKESSPYSSMLEITITTLRVLKLLSDHTKPQALITYLPVS